MAHTYLNQQLVWITGASSGIGEALAVSAARSGARLILSARRRSELERVAALCTGAASVRIVPLDLADTASVVQAATEVMTRDGLPDVLVNNAGVTQRALAREATLDVVRSLMEVNFFGTVALTGQLLPAMHRRGSGRIVVISSVAGKLGTPLRSGYAAAKHALHGYFDSLRAEEHDHGLRVTVVCPGFIRTPISQSALTASGAAQGSMDAGQSAGMDAGECAQRIWQAVGQEREEVVIAGLKEGSGVYLKRFAPGLLNRIVRKAKVV